MDLKTLEYMEERAKKARKIVSRIDELTKKVPRVQRCTYLIFNSTEHGNHTEEKENRLVEKMKTAFINTVLDEIERLEQELAEL